MQIDSEDDSPINRRDDSKIPYFRKLIMMWITRLHEPIINSLISEEMRYILIYNAKHAAKMVMQE